MPTTVSDADLQLKYLAQQIHKTLVQISSGINTQIGAFKMDLAQELNLIEGAMDPSCFTDSREFWINQLWNFFLRIGQEDQDNIEILAKDPRVQQITTNPQLITLGQQYQQLQAQG